MLWLTERVTRYSIPVTMPLGYSADAVLAGLVEGLEQIPEHQLANPKKPEWGIPVRIAMPDASKLPLRPGELVVLNYINEGKE